MCTAYKLLNFFYFCFIFVSLSLKINRAISKEISCDFKNIDPRKGLKPLWVKVKSLTNKDPESNYSTHITATDLNLHYSSISTVQNYSPQIYDSQSLPNTLSSKNTNSSIYLTI